MLVSGIGEAYDPVTGKGVVGKNYCYQTGASAMLFFEDKHFHPFMATGGMSTLIDDFTRTGNSTAHPSATSAARSSVPPCTAAARSSGAPTPARTPGWGKQWKDETAKWYDRSMNIVAAGSVMPNRGNYLDLDPIYRNRFGLPQIRMTFDYKDNERKISAHAAKVINDIAMAMNPTHLDKATARNSCSAVPDQSTHNSGGTIMGTNPGNSVTNKYGQVWGVDNLFIMGASLFPHNSAYNPTGPVAAIAYMAADIIKNVYVKNPGKLIDA